MDLHDFGGLTLGYYWLSNASMSNQRSLFSPLGIADKLPMYCRYFADKL